MGFLFVISKKFYTFGLLFNRILNFVCMIQAFQIDFPLRKKNFRKSGELLLISPDPEKLTEKSLLRRLIPNDWKESVYEYENKYFINLVSEKAITRSEEFYLIDVVAKEFGYDNIIFPNIIRNKSFSSSIDIQLKKSNYGIELTLF